MLIEKKPNIVREVDNLKIDREKEEPNADRERDRHDIDIERVSQRLIEKERSQA
jgi:hypothetical protein